MAEGSGQACWAQVPLGDCPRGSKIGLSVIVWQDGASIDGGKLLEEHSVEQPGVLCLIHQIEKIGRAHV